MKIVCLIRRGAPLYYFVNKINSEHQVKEVIIERPRSHRKNIFLRLKKSDLRGY